MPKSNVEIAKDFNEAYNGNRFDEAIGDGDLVAILSVASGTNSTYQAVRLLDPRARETNGQLSGRGTHTSPHREFSRFNELLCQTRMVKKLPGEEQLLGLECIYYKP